MQSQGHCWSIHGQWRRLPSEKGWQRLGGEEENEQWHSRSIALWPAVLSNPLFPSFSLCCLYLRSSNSLMDDSPSAEEIQEWLLANNLLSLSSVDSRGCSPLHVACEQGNLRYVKWLLEQGALISEPTTCNDGLSPFTMAVRNDRLELSKWIFAHYCADPTLAFPIHNAPNKRGSIPLMYAAESASIELVEWMISIGANFRARNNKGSTVLMWATSNPNLEVLKYITSLDEAQLRQPNEEGMTPLSFAVMEERVDVFNFLIARGVPTSHRNVAGLSPLLLAVRYGKLEMLKQLLRCGESLKETNDRGANALLIAAQHGHLETMKFSHTEGGLPINSAASNGCTAFMYACDGGNIEVAKWLISMGADIHERSPLGTTACMFAAIGGHTALIQWLHTEHHVNLELANKHGFTALTYAADHGRLETVKWMLHEAKVPLTINRKTSYSILMDAASNGHIPLVEYLIKENLVDPHYSVSGVNAFSIAALKDKVAMMEWLYYNVPGINITEHASGETQFFISPVTHMAVIHNSRNALKWLVRHGVDVNGVSYLLGSRPISTVAEKGESALLSWMMSQGADPTVRDQFGFSLYHLASRQQAQPIRDFYLRTFGHPLDQPLDDHDYTDSDEDLDYSSDPGPDDSSDSSPPTTYGSSSTDDEEES